MRFGFLTYGLDRPAFGISRTVLSLGQALARRSDCEPVYITPYRSGPFVDARSARAYLPGARLLPGIMSLGALQLPLVARRHALPLIHDPVGVNPFLVGRSLGPYKRVVTLYDATPFRYPEGYTWLNNFLHRRYVPASLGNVDAVITISEASRLDLLHFFNLAEEKVHAVPLAADPMFHPVAAEDAAVVARRYGLRAPFVLYVGALEPRKNIPTLLRACARLRAEFPGLTLGLGGSPRWKIAEIHRTLDELALGSAVHFTGYVADADLPALYSAASAFCFPSLYEGFGLPVLEAMACGTPVVCSNVSSLPEVAGDSALLVDPRDEMALADALNRVLTDRILAEDLRRRGLAQAAKFSWDRTADLTLALYWKVLAA